MALYYLYLSVTIFASCANYTFFRKIMRSLTKKKKGEQEEEFTCMNLGLGLLRSSKSFLLNITNAEVTLIVLYNSIHSSLYTFHRITAQRP